MPSHFYHGLFGIHILLSLLPTAPPTRKKQKQSFTKFFVPFCLINLSPKKTGPKQKSKKILNMYLHIIFSSIEKNHFLFEKRSCIEKKSEKNLPVGKCVNVFPTAKKREYQGHTWRLKVASGSLYFFGFNFLGSCSFGTSLI
jgi:hypothetical protein